MVRLVLRDDQFERIAALLPGKASDPGRTAADNRLFVEAVLWIARTGSPWRDLPHEFGPWNSVYQRFARWSRSGVWHRVFAQLAQDADFEEVFIDSTIVRAHQHAAGAPQKKVTKRSGDPVADCLTGGEAGDSPEALPLLGNLQPDSLSADKAYDTDAILEHLAIRGIDAVIPPRSHRIVQRDFDRHQYKNRNLVERFFCRIKQFRRIATRYDKLAERFASFVALTAAVIWMA